MELPNLPKLKQTFIKYVHDYIERDGIADLLKKFHRIPVTLVMG